MKSNIMYLPQLDRHAIGTRDILLLGEGNFSFAVAFCKRHPWLCSQVVATDICGEVTTSNIRILEALGVLVGVLDASRLPSGCTFSRVQFNCPCGDHATPIPEVVDRLFAWCRTGLAKGGTVHISCHGNQRQAQQYLMLPSIVRKHGFELHNTNDTLQDRYPGYTATRTNGGAFQNNASHCVSEYVFHVGEAGVWYTTHGSAYTIYKVYTQVVEPQKPISQPRPSLHPTREPRARSTLRDSASAISEVQTQVRKPSRHPSLHHAGELSAQSTTMGSAHAIPMPHSPVVAQGPSRSDQRLLKKAPAVVAAVPKKEWEPSRSDQCLLKKAPAVVDTVQKKEWEPSRSDQCLLKKAPAVVDTVQKKEWEPSRSDQCLLKKAPAVVAAVPKKEWEPSRSDQCLLKKAPAVVDTVQKKEWEPSRSDQSLLKKAPAVVYAVQKKEWEPSRSDQCLLKKAPAVVDTVQKKEWEPSRSDQSLLKKAPAVVAAVPKKEGLRRGFVIRWVVCCFVSVFLVMAALSPFSR